MIQLQRCGLNDWRLGNVFAKDELVFICRRVLVIESWPLARGRGVRRLAMEILLRKDRAVRSLLQVELRIVAHPETIFPVAYVERVGLGWPAASSFFG